MTRKKKAKKAPSKVKGTTHDGSGYDGNYVLEVDLSARDLLDYVRDRGAPIPVGHAHELTWGMSCHAYLYDVTPLDGGVKLVVDDQRQEEARAEDDPSVEVHQLRGLKLRVYLGGKGRS